MMPDSVEEDRGPYRPIAAMAVSRNHGVIGSSDELADSGPAPRQAEQALAALAKIVGSRPGVIEVCEPAVAQRLRQHRRWRDCEVRVCDELAGHRAVYLSLRDELNAEDPRAPLIAGEGVALDRVRRFAEVAIRFWEAARCLLFANGDLIQLDPPPAASDLRVGVVMGAAGEEYGVLLAASPAAFSDAADDPDSPPLTETLWSVSFDEPYESPVADSDLWLEHGLPTTPDGRIPSPRAFKPGPESVERPTAERLAALEGVLEALAILGEDEADSGRWSTRVDTASGELELRLSLPEIDDVLVGALTAETEDDDVDDEDEGEDGPSVPPPQDVDLLVDLSLGTDGRLAARLAARALELEPDFARAHVAAGLAAVDPARRSR